MPLHTVLLCLVRPKLPSAEGIQAVPCPRLPAVSSALLEVLLQELGDPVTQDLCLAALQKLSVRLADMVDRR